MARRKAAAITQIPRGLPASFDEAIRHAVTAFFGSGVDLDEDVILVAEVQLWAARHPEVRPAHLAMVTETIDFVTKALDVLLALYGMGYRVEKETAIRTLHATLDYYRFRSLVDDGDRLKAQDRMIELCGVLFSPPTR